MKQSKTISNILVGLLAVGVVLYFVLSMWQSFTNPFTTTIAYQFTISDAIDAQAILIREETTLPLATSGLLDVLRTEGEQVGKGQVVARSYKDSATMSQQIQLESYQSQVALLDYALAGGEDVVSVAKLNEDIVQGMAALRSAATTGNYNQLEPQVAQVKGSILRRDYIFGGTALAVEMEQQRQLLLSHISGLSQQVTTDVTYITTPVSGAFSILVDGFEHITPLDALSLDKNGLEVLLNTPTATPHNTGGKIITGNTWYLALSLPTAYVTQLQVGRSITVRFTGDFAQDISMTLEKITRNNQDDTQVVVLSSNRYLEQTTLLRHQLVELIYESHTGLRIPKMALRMQTSTNSQGETTETLGVYVVSAGYAEFKPVNLVTESSEYYLVEPAKTGAGALRDGNEVIVNAVGLYHGKLLEY